MSGSAGQGVVRTYVPRWEMVWTLDQSKAEEVWSGALGLVSASLAKSATDNRRMPVFHEKS